MRVDDGGRLFVNNAKVIDQWKDQSATEYTPDVDLPGGSLPVGQRGGPDGSEPHATFAAQAAARLAPGAVVGFWLHSLPDPRLLKAYAAFDLSLVSWKRRFLQPDEYEDVLPYFLARARNGESYIAEASRRPFLVGGVWLARHR